MKRLLSIVPLLFLLTLTGFAQGVCSRYSEPAVGFSMCAPDGWEISQREGQKYKMMFGARTGTFTPNINFKDEANTLPLKDYAAAAARHIQGNYQKIGATSIRLISQENFVTTEGKSGIKLTFSTDYKGTAIRTLQFYFNGKPGQKLIVTCTSLESEKASLDPLFDRALKSFRVNQ